jgi:phosphoribosylanthranilate isomerase
MIRNLICGVVSAADVAAAVNAGADAIGIPAAIGSEHAQHLAMLVPPALMSVLVADDPDPHTLGDLVEEVQPSMLLLTTPITTTQRTRIRRAVGRRLPLAVRVTDVDTAQTLIPLVDAVLVDYTVLTETIRDLASVHGTPVIVDGALVAATVGNVLSGSGADGVAVNRGVTGVDGGKDRDKCAAFIAATEPVFEPGRN